MREHVDPVDPREDRGRPANRDDRRDDHDTPRRPADIPLHPELKIEERSVYGDDDLRSRHAEDLQSNRGRTTDPKGKERARGNTPEVRREAPGLHYQDAFVQKIVELSRDVAKITNRAAQDTAAFERDAERIKTCTELSSTLANISSSTNAIVTPALAAVIASHGKNHDRMEADFKRLGHLWEDLFQHFMNSIVQAIDSEVGIALDRFRHELSAQLPSYPPMPFSASPVEMHRSGDNIPMMRKRKIADADSMMVDRDFDMGNRNISGSEYHRASSYEDEQGAKRRRLHNDNSMNSSLDLSNPDVLAMVHEMTAKLRQQEETLAQLQEENERLKDRGNTPSSVHYNMRAPSYPPRTATEASSMPGSATSRAFSPQL